MTKEDDRRFHWRVNEESIYLSYEVYDTNYDNEGREMRIAAFESAIDAEAFTRRKNSGEIV